VHPLILIFNPSMIPMTSAWLPTLAAAGIPTNQDAYNGNNIGGFFSTMAINPTNWTRSYSKSAYIDTLPPRDNLHVLTNAAVTKITFADNVQDGNKVASGVQFASGASDTPKSVSANKEVILAGGAVGSPQMLLVSGVGPKDVLDSAGISVQVELPGVGQHLQDHLVR
jgi:choline dehydrogenase-like flavoprotein